MDAVSGATLPMGLVKISPDNQGNVWNGGYEYTIASISGFSLRRLRAQRAWNCETAVAPAIVVKRWHRLIRLISPSRANASESAASV